MRIAILLCLICSCHLSAAELVRDDLLGFWQLDETAVTENQKAAAEQAKKVEMFGISLTNRIGRVIFSSDSMVAGMWRLDNATETTATLVIQHKGGDEHTYQLTVTGKDKDMRITVKQAPAGLTFMRK